MEGHLEIVLKLLEVGVDPLHIDNDGWNALMKAAWNGHLEIVLKLIEHGANPYQEYKGLNVFERYDDNGSLENNVINSLTTMRNAIVNALPEHSENQDRIIADIVASFLWSYKLRK